MNAVVTQETRALAASQSSGRMAVADIISHVAMVQEVMKAVMKPDVHYGVIPGTDKPTLYKQGAEVLCMAFRVSDTYAVEDLSTADVVRYRVTCTGAHQMSGLVLGTGMGEASSAEEKYKWRKAWDDEFEATPANLRRIKLGKYKTKQIRTEPADLANTILKMANKRAKIAMTINVTACGDMFGQDLEDMDAALREHLTRHGEDGGQQDQPAAPAALPEFTEAHLQERAAKIAQFYAAGKSADDIIAFYALKATLPDAMKEAIRKMAPAAAPSPTGAPAVTYAQVDAQMRAAKAEDALNEVAALIPAVADEAQRAELNTTYDQLLAALRG